MRKTLPLLLILFFITTYSLAGFAFVFNGRTERFSAEKDTLTLQKIATNDIFNGDFTAQTVFYKFLDNTDVLLYFWMFDDTLANETPLINVEATYERSGNALLQYQSCLTGYPFGSFDSEWRKASMERRDSPTDVNYIDDANNGVSYDDAIVNGLQVKQPFQRDGLENRLIFNIPSTGYRDMKFAFALKDEGAASGIIIEYSVILGNPQWISLGLGDMPLTVSSEYQLYEVDFSAIPSADDNTNFKVRIRFTGDNMTVDNGDRVTLNNISVHGVSLTAGKDNAESDQFNIYPNPVTNLLQVSHAYSNVGYSLLSADGKLINEGMLKNQQIDMQPLQPGVYILRFTANGISVMKKIVKR